MFEENINGFALDSDGIATIYFRKNEDISSIPVKMRNRITLNYCFDVR